MEAAGEDLVWASYIGGVQLVSQRAYSSEIPGAATFEIRKDCSIERDPVQYDFSLNLRTLTRVCEM